MSKNGDSLDDNIRDKLVAATKGAVGIIPWVGGPLGELVAQVIPQQRQDRIVAYLRALNDRIELLEADEVSEFLGDVEKVDLIEVGGYQAARAVSQERMSYIVEMVANGLSREASEVLRRKRLLKLLGEIDDDEVLLLIAYGSSYGKSLGDPEARAAWDNINRPDPIHLSSQKPEIEEDKLFELGKTRLLQFGLLERKHIKVKKGELPEFDDKTGTLKGRIQISYLGRMFLNDIAIP